MSASDDGRLAPSSALQETRVVAILRAQHGGRLEPVVDTLASSGIRCLELTMTTPDALPVVERLARRLGEDVDLGMGTVLTAEDAHRAADAGARFVVSPSLAPGVVAAATARGIASYPGAFSPSELQSAWEAGASAVKLFPAGALGPSYLSAVRAPLPHIPVVPTGGIDVGSVAAWLDAGAYAVGLGSPLLGDALSEDGDLDALAERSRRALAEAAGARR